MSRYSRARHVFGPYAMCRLDMTDTIFEETSYKRLECDYDNYQSVLTAVPLNSVHDRMEKRFLRDGPGIVCVGV